MREDTTRTRDTAADGADDDASTGSDSLFGDLSGAAREAVRSPADPRLDSVLAHLGLADDAPVADEPVRSTSPAPTESPAPPTTPEPVAAATAVAHEAAHASGPAGDAQHAALAMEVDRLRALVAAQETGLAELRDRVRTLAMVAGAGLVVGVVGLLVALIR